MVEVSLNRVILGKALRALPLGEQRKRAFLVVSAVLGAVAIWSFAFWDLFQGNTSELWFHILNGGIILGVGLGLRHMRDGQVLYRIASLLTLLAVTQPYILFTHEPPEILWLFPVPLILLYLLGNREGKYWLMAVAIFIALLLFFPRVLNSYVYPPVFKYYFLISFVLVAVFSFYIEHLRALYETRIAQRRRALKEAKAQIRQLKGLVPVCHRCKSVRDDAGYWRRLEEFLEGASDVSFSHGICDSCIKKEYPELYEQMQSRRAEGEGEE